jgi:hypothetical protein
MNILNKIIHHSNLVSISKWDEQFEKLESLDTTTQLNIYSFMHGYLKCNPDVYEAINEAIENERHYKSKN